MTRRDRGAIGLLTALVLSACGSTEPSLQRVAVSGTVTSGGQPATGVAEVTLGVTGSPDPVLSTLATLDGTYAIAADVDSARCGRLFVSVSLVNAFGQTVGQATEALRGCGTHVVDLVLGP